MAPPVRKEQTVQLTLALAMAMWCFGQWDVSGSDSMPILSQDLAEHHVFLLTALTHLTFAMKIAWETHWADPNLTSSLKPNHSGQPQFSAQGRNACAVPLGFWIQCYCRNLTILSTGHPTNIPAFCCFPGQLSQDFSLKQNLGFSDVDGGCWCWCHSHNSCRLFGCLIKIAGPTEQSAAA